MTALEEFGTDWIGCLEVGKGKGKGVGGVWGRSFRETEECAHHEGDLAFVSGAFTDDGHFDFFRRVFVNGNAVISGGNEGGGTSGTHGDGGLVGLDIDDALDGDFVGFVLGYEVNEVSADGGECGGLGDFLGDGDDVIGDGLRMTGIAIQNGISGVADSGIDGKDAHGRIKAAGWRAGKRQMWFSELSAGRWNMRLPCVRVVYVVILLFLQAGLLRAQVEELEIPDAPETGLWDRQGLFDNNVAAKQRIIDALRGLEADYGYRLFVVIEGTLIGSKSEKFADDIQKKWLPEGGGMVLLYESDRRAIQYGLNPDMAEEITEGRTLVSSLDIIQIFSKSFQVCKEIRDNQIFIERFVMELCANFEEAIDQKDQEPEKEGRALRLALIVIGAVAILALFGLVFGMLMGRAGGKRRRVKSFPKVDVVERLGAPYGGALASLRFRKDGDV